MNTEVSSLRCLEAKEIQNLRLAGYASAADLLVTPPQEIAKKTKISVQNLEELIQRVSLEVAPTPRVASETPAVATEQFTTGDDLLDDILGGGIRTGLVWEVSGEGGAGKTQLALQLALTVQLPQELGGLSGSTCYLSTGAALPTARLQQLVDNHPRLSSGVASLSHIHNHPITIPRALTYVLGTTLPNLIRELCEPGARPVRLIVIDSLASLFRTSKATSTHLFERSKTLGEVSSLLHFLAVKHSLAVVVTNGVNDVFGQDLASPFHSPNPPADRHELVYKDQARWFSRPGNTYWSNTKEAGLGLVWANQVNVRLFVSRTERRKVNNISTNGHANRSTRPRDVPPHGSPDLQDVSGDDTVSPGHSPITLDPQGLLLRRLDIIFSSYFPPQSVDFVLTPSGLWSVMEESLTKPPAGEAPDRTEHSDPVLDAPLDMSTHIPSSSLGSSQAREMIDIGGVLNEDDWDQYITGLDDDE